MSEDAQPKQETKAEGSDHINLRVTGQGQSMSNIRFRFDGQAINQEDTPNKLEMEDEDTIDVFTQQTGGNNLSL